MKFQQHIVERAEGCWHFRKTNNMNTPHIQNNIEKSSANGV